MIERMDPDQVAWFAAWVTAISKAPEGPELPMSYARTVRVQHAGDDEGHPSDIQKAALDRILLAASGQDAPACLASYDPVPGEGDTSEIPFATRVVGHIEYLLVAGPLRDLVYLPWESRWDYEQPVTMLWPADRSWCLASDPDVTHTVVGGPAPLIKAILADPRLYAEEYRAGDEDCRQKRRRSGRGRRR
ncbi:hypothetical protein LO762_15385 [Actinocorallia sp. API 0066]|uniref:hypothetical protein n=1 Tax=Actinocorallia sp. API 0066 TaxID=2896846 RepID=UPI001E4807AD|nr:hypothetical protein [Actinocorallia sp. API 0066]MCD0450562.1 hypothetical protein [Actinocorallia sp. API 0066]